MAGEIRDIGLKFSCTQNWEAMPQTAGGRYCNVCQKQVYDFTGSKVDEFWGILIENNYTVCGRFTHQQLATETNILSPWKKWLSAALVFMGFNLWQNQAHAQTATPASNNQAAGNTVVPKSDTLQAVFGGTEMLPDFPGGMNKLNAFIKANLNPEKASKPCRVNVAFTIDKDGSVKDIKAIGDNGDAGARREAIRVVKLLPKWTPGRQNGQTVRMQFMIPFVFQLK